MNILKCVKRLKIPRWSALFPFIFYLIFILFILNISFPLKSSTSTTVISSSTDIIKNSQSVKSSSLVNKNNEISKRKKPETVIITNADTDGTNILKDAFKKADMNFDSVLTIQELARYINGRVRDHIDNAIRTNPFSFAEIDISPRDGLITWDEYHAHFLRERGLDEDYITEHNEKKHSKLDRKSKEAMMRDKALWLEAARTDPLSLTLDEFLAFRHPESSAANLLSLVDDLLRQFDEDGDELLTIDEFASSDEEEDDKDQFQLQIQQKPAQRKSVAEKREEFKRLIDRNGDGKADRGELLSYVDPRHPRHALQESATLFSLADKNKDKKLSLKEVLANAPIFLASKMINTAESFHEEF